MSGFPRVLGIFHVLLLGLCFAQISTLTVDPPANVDLQFGDINVLVLTDVHSWVGGHGSNEPDQNSDYGDVLSFYERLQAYCVSKGMDLWFVVNGDWIDGTGLSLNGDIQYLTPLLERMPWDALNVGNHELYKDKVVRDFSKPGGFVEWWGNRYLSTNVFHVDKKEPLGERFQFLRGRNSTTLTFGFLYNMKDHSSVVEVEEVEDVVEEKWFADVITNPDGEPHGGYDAILVLAHMDVKDELVSVVLNKIRSLVGESMPVQFITGHTHYRGVHTMDGAAVSFEAGRFLDTVGFVSFPKQQTLLEASKNRELESKKNPPLLGPGGTEWPNVSDASTNNTGSNNDETSSPSSPVAVQTTPGSTEAPNSPQLQNASILATVSPSMPPTKINAPLFHHRFIDANVATLASILGVTDLATEEGARLSTFIKRTRSELGLLDLAGCAPQNYYLNRTVTEKDSLWRVFLEKMVPDELLEKAANSSSNRQKMFLAGSGGLRYDLIGRTLIVDDVIAVSPFNETIFALGPEIPGWAVTEVITQVLNTKPSTENPKWENFFLSPALDELQSNINYEILTPEWGVSYIVNGFKAIQYNGTVEQKETRYTSTGIWLDYIKREWKCTDDEVATHHHNNNPHGGSTPSGGKNDGRPTSPFQDPDSAEKDRRRFIVALVFVGCVLILGTLYIWQLHESWLTRYSERQRVLYEADAQFLGDEENELI